MVLVLKYLLILVPTVVLFGCRASVPAMSGFATASDGVTYSTSRPTYEDPFASLQQSGLQTATAQPASVQQTSAADPGFDPFANLPGNEAEFQQATQGPVDDETDPEAGGDTSWYDEDLEAGKQVTDSGPSPTDDLDSPGWRRSRATLSAN